MFTVKRILVSRPVVSRFLLPAVSSLQTENKHFANAVKAGADNKSCARGAKRQYFMSFTFEKSNPLFCA